MNKGKKYNTKEDLSFLLDEAIEERMEKEREKEKERTLKAFKLFAYAPLWSTK
jgi:hypothetical protein